MHERIHIHIDIILSSHTPHTQLTASEYEILRMCAFVVRWEVGAVPNVLTGYIHCFYTSISSSSDPGKEERGRRKGGGRGGEREDGWGMREGEGEWNEKCKNET